MRTFKQSLWRWAFYLSGLLEVALATMFAIIGPVKYIIRSIPKNIIAKYEYVFIALFFFIFYIPIRFLTMKVRRFLSMKASESDELPDDPQGRHS